MATVEQAARLGERIDDFVYLYPSADIPEYGVARRKTATVGGKDADKEC